MHFDIDKIFKKLKDILVIWETHEQNLLIKDFNNEEEVADFIGTSAYFIKKTLDGKDIRGCLWKPNIFFKPIDKERHYRYIVVYTEDWRNYSEVKRRNRIKKLLK